MSETFIKIDLLQHIEIIRQTYPTTSALQHSLFCHSANFSKLMRTIHISMTDAFQCEYCTFKRCDKFKLKFSIHHEVCIVRINKLA